MAHVAVLGASGLIGHAITRDLLFRGYQTCAIARSFTPAQKAALASSTRQSAIVLLDQIALADLLEDADIVVNCIGVLQDSPGVSADEVHRAFAARLARACAPDKLLIHLSMPGTARDDITTFSRSKRAAEAAIANGGAPYMILRPGFVIAPTAFGGSALIRALAALPLALPAREAGAPFAVTDIHDICETVAQLVDRWRNAETSWATRWDVMSLQPTTVADVVAAFRFQADDKLRLSLPGWLMTTGAWAGDAVSWLGWRPPIRSTALTEMRRGVSGDPHPWIAATGITPRTLAAALPPSTVQERWFARLYLLKALALSMLVLFWTLSGLIALTVAFHAAEAILIHHGFAPPLAHAATIVTSLTDISIGLAIAWRRTCRIGLIAGILQSLFYMVAAAVLTPDMWVEPLGALVKTGPAIVLMLVCLALLEDR